MCETFAGGVNEVRRVGDDMIRPKHPWMANAHGLLRHLADAGLSTVPRVRELREHTERLSFIPGHVSHYPLSRKVTPESVLVSAARMLRQYHDATVDYVTEHGHGWQLPSRDPVEVLCHGDFAPYNVVVRDGEAVGITITAPR